MKRKEDELQFDDMAGAIWNGSEEDSDMVAFEDIQINHSPDQGYQVGYAEGFAEGKNTMLKELIKRKLLKGQTSQQIAEDLDEDIIDIEMLIVQILERC